MRIPSKKHVHNLKIISLGGDPVHPKSIKKYPTHKIEPKSLVDNEKYGFIARTIKFERLTWFSFSQFLQWIFQDIMFFLYKKRNSVRLYDWHYFPKFGDMTTIKVDIKRFEKQKFELIYENNLLVISK